MPPTRGPPPPAPCGCGRAFTNPTTAKMHKAKCPLRSKKLEEIRVKRMERKLELEQELAHLEAAQLLEEQHEVRTHIMPLSPQLTLNITAS